MKRLLLVVLVSAGMSNELQGRFSPARGINLTTTEYAMRELGRLWAIFKDWVTFSEEKKHDLRAEVINNINDWRTKNNSKNAFPELDKGLQAILDNKNLGPNQMREKANRYIKDSVRKQMDNLGVPVDKVQAVINNISDDNFPSKEVVQIFDKYFYEPLAKSLGIAFKGSQSLRNFIADRLAKTMGYKNEEMFRADHGGLGLYNFIDIRISDQGKPEAYFNFNSVDTANFSDINRGKLLQVKETVRKELGAVFEDGKQAFSFEKIWNIKPEDMRSLSGLSYVDDNTGLGSLSSKDLQINDARVKYIESTLGKSAGRGLFLIFTEEVAGGRATGVYGFMRPDGVFSEITDDNIIRKIDENPDFSGFESGGNYSDFANPVEGGRFGGGIE